MGSFDLFCALCSGSLTGAQAGSTAPRALARRRRLVERKRRALLAGKEPPPVETDSDSNGTDDECEEDPNAVGEEYAYDPELVSDDSLEWLEVVLGLGLNEETEEAVLTDEGYYTEQGNVFVPWGDDQTLTRFSGYSTFDAVFPFHVPCFKILTWILTGDMGGEQKINKNILRSVFDTLDKGTNLNLNYGPITGCAQFWDSAPGEEFSVANPIDIPGLSDFLKAKLDSSTFQLSSTNHELRPRVISDPFARLPYEVLHLVLRLLPGSSTLAIAAASWSVHLAIGRGSFWKEMLQREMPWFYELFHLLEDEKYLNLDYKRLCLWLDKELSIMYGLRGPLMGIANRKRIWGACQKIKDLYFAQQ